MTSRIGAINADLDAGQVDPSEAALYRDYLLGETEEAEAEPTEEERLRDRFDPQEFDWADIVSTHVFDSLQQWERNTGQVEGMGRHILREFEGDMFTAVNNNLLRRADEQVGSHFIAVNTTAEERAGTVLEMGSGWFKHTNDGVQQMIDYAINFIGGQAGIQLERPTVSGGGRGGGRRGPTAQDIRNQFDIEELARAVDDMSRSLVFEPHKNGKKLAREYVEAVVRGKGETKIDFATFVESRIEGTSRYKSIYRNKPESMSAQQYMAPYFQQAQAVARPGEAADLAIGGAQFGASTEQFRQRLSREDSVTGSSPFINSIEGRLRELNSVFKG